MKKLTLLLLGAVLVSCAPVSERENRVSDLEVRVTRLEQKQEDMEKDLLKTNEKIDKVTEILSELRLELEKLKLKAPEQVSQPKSEHRPAKEDQKPEEGTAEGTAPKEDAESAYKSAIELYTLKKLYEARDAFIDFIKNFPENKYTDNAFFWIGRIYQELGDVHKAERIYKSLAKKCESGRLPDCNKLPDAYFQLMKIYTERGNRKEADRYYSILVERFPASDATVRAKKYRLEKR